MANGLTSTALLHGWLHKGTEIDPPLGLYFKAYLQSKEFRQWAMLGSNQRPLPWEGTVYRIASAHHSLQTRITKPFSA
jgi:hypothetical protein